MTHIGTHGERRAVVYLDYWLVGVTHSKGWTFTLDGKAAQFWVGEGDDMWDDLDDAKRAAEKHVGVALSWRKEE